MIFVVLSICLCMSQISQSKCPKNWVACDGSRCAENEAKCNSVKQAMVGSNLLAAAKIGLLVMTLG